MRNKQINKQKQHSEIKEKAYGFINQLIKMYFIPECGYKNMNKGVKSIKVTS